MPTYINLLAHDYLARTSIIPLPPFPFPRAANHAAQGNDCSTSGQIW